MLGVSEPGGGENPLVASTSEARSPLPPGAVAEEGCAVGDAAAVADPGVPMDGVGSSPPAFATVPTPGSTTESASADPAPEPTSEPAEACRAPEPVPDPVPTPATLWAERSAVIEELVGFGSFAPCVTVGAMLDGRSESRAGEGPEGEAGSEAASESEVVEGAAVGPRPLRRRPGFRWELRLRPALIQTAVSWGRQEHRRRPGRRLK